jgi:hypothetical protein
VITHQYLHQLTPQIRHAVLGIVGTFISFRVGPEDASNVVREFQSSVFEPEDVINLENYRIYLKLLIDGMRPEGPTGNCLDNLDWLDSDERNFQLWIVRSTIYRKVIAASGDMSHSPRRF